MVFLRGLIKRFEGKDLGVIGLNVLDVVFDLIFELRGEFVDLK